SGSEKTRSRVSSSAHAAHDEVRGLAQSVALRSIRKPIERAEGCVVKGKCTLARSFGTTRATDLREQRTHVAFGLGRGQDARLELAASAVTFEDGVDHRQGRHPLEEVLADGLPQLSRVADEIEYVIGDLEGHTEVCPKRSERGDMIRLGIGEESRSLAARRVERRGLQLDAVEIRGLAGKGPRRGDLAEIAIAERDDGLRVVRGDLGLR